MNRLTRAHVKDIIGAKANTPHAANSLLKMLRIPLGVAVSIEMIENNPAIGVKKYKTSGGGFHSWTENEIVQFEGRHPIGTRARLAFALLLYTAKRRAGVVRMGWQQLKVFFPEHAAHNDATARLAALHASAAHFATTLHELLELEACRFATCPRLSVASCAGLVGLEGVNAVQPNVLVADPEVIAVPDVDRAAKSLLSKGWLARDQNGRDQRQRRPQNGGGTLGCRHNLDHA